MKYSVGDEGQRVSKEWNEKKKLNLCHVMCMKADKLWNDTEEKMLDIKNNTKCLKTQNLAKMLV